MKSRTGPQPELYQDTAAFKAEDAKGAGRAAELPAGSRSGLYLHAALEELPLEALARAGSLEAFCELPEVETLFSQLAREHGVAPQHIRHAQALVYTALTSEVALGERRIAGLASAGRPLREMEFLFPLPERAGAAIAGTAVVVAGRGFVRGFVDYLFEHEGLAYFADWKSDALADFSPDALARHVDRNYAVQAQLYSLALVKLLGIPDEAEYQARFGGLLFCFLRGMRTGGTGREGLYFRRPSWAEIRGFHDALVTADAADAGDDAAHAVDEEEAS
jgi:exodeoxyribonuclease V beta subunit